MITILLSISWLPAVQLEKLPKILHFYCSPDCSALVELSNKRRPQDVNWKYRLDWTRYSHTVNCPRALLYFLSLRFSVFLVKIWWIEPIFPLSDQEFLDFLLSPFEKYGSVAWLFCTYFNAISAPFRLVLVFESLKYLCSCVAVFSALGTRSGNISKLQFYLIFKHRSWVTLVSIIMTSNFNPVNIPIILSCFKINLLVILINDPGNFLTDLDKVDTCVQTW